MRIFQYKAPQPDDFEERTASRDHIQILPSSTSRKKTTSTTTTTTTRTTSTTTKRPTPRPTYKPTPQPTPRRPSPSETPAAIVQKPKSCQGKRVSSKKLNRFAGEKNSQI